MLGQCPLLKVRSCGAWFCQCRIAIEISSGPLSPTTIAGLPRIATTASSSRTTRVPLIDVSATSARHSREVVDNCLNPEAAAVRETVGYEVQRPQARRCRQHPAGRSRSQLLRLPNGASHRSMNRNRLGESGAVQLMWSSSRWRSWHRAGWLGHRLTLRAKVQSCRPGC